MTPPLTPIASAIRVTPATGATDPWVGLVVARGQDAGAVLLAVVGCWRAISLGAAASVAIAVTVVLVGWYFLRYAWTTPAGGPTPGWLVGLATAWLVAVVVSAEFIWWAFLLWLIVGQLLRLRWALAAAGLIFAVVVAVPLLHHGSTSYATIFGPLIGALFAITVARSYLLLLADAQLRQELVASLQATQAEILDLQDELALTQRHAGMVAERTRLAGDIHDTVAQELISIRLLAHAGAHAAHPAEMRTHLEQVEELAAASIGQVRRIVAALTPAELESGALAVALERMVQRLRTEAGVEAHLQVDTTLPGLAPSVEVALLRTAQSAFANIRQHAGATTAMVSLIDDDDTIRLDIVDDGVGFDPLAVPQNAGTSVGLGLARARLRELGGGLDIAAEAGQGTSLSAYLPLQQRGVRS